MATDKLILNLPLNSLSLGQVSYNIVRELYRRKIQCVIFPKGPVDVSAYKADPQFNTWIERAINDRFKKFSKDTPTLSCWHLNGSEFKPSNRQYLLSFHETDSPTEHEINIANQQEQLFFSSSWSVDSFQQYGAKNSSFIPLGLDEDFQLIPERLVSNDITHWILVGKWEILRKMTDFKIRLWAKKYGGNPKHHLTICVDNPFFQKQSCGFDMNDVYSQFFGSPDWQKTKPFNINVLPHLKTNVEMNQLYNSADIDLSGWARSEGWNIPAFTATALGKWSIVTNCTAHKDWATAENCVLVSEPKGIVPAVDNIFFQKDSPFSSGNMYDFSEEQFVEAMERAAKLAKTPNPAGRKLATEFTYKRTVDELLAKIN